MNQVLMNHKLTFLKEPRLTFGYGQSLEDPHDGLTLFGPCETFGLYTMQVGVIGTPEGIELYKKFVGALNKPIKSDDERSRPSFPGFQSVFGVVWPQTPAYTHVLTKQALSKTLSIRDVRMRTYETVNTYLREIVKVHQREETKLDVWVLVVPKDIWLKCRTNAPTTGLNSAHIMEVESLKEGQKMMFDFLQEQYEEEAKALELDWDFHDQMKARLLQKNVNIPIQILLEPTLQFKDKYREWEYTARMKAHLAWTQSVTMYYKLGKLPWKLSEIRKGVCYLGLVFKKYEHGRHQGYACSAAQMFLHSGDGTVFRGNIGDWLNRDSKEYHLDYKAARALLSLAMESYFQRNNCYPEELFIHGRADFGHDEWDGFSDLVAQTNSQTKLVGVVIKESGKLKLFRHVESELCEYGNLRGLALPISDSEGFLWTRGFVPRLNTSTSLEIPNPLRIKVARGQADIVQVIQDILCLTKLNYNACIYGDGLPVTLRFSDRIGDILTAVDSLNENVLPFKYYI
jgi:hypothetical protein